eukprot:TRINITY_DN555_c0_g1_i1.p1 TRINITY_DN555_c0_g1~~TRINITY_DN555_c0_g1_i1.p1  ORF type:complete len:234 (+),score=53.91 TRINITY_DN555_c0_g1_i1:88-789(+)
MLSMLAWFLMVSLVGGEASMGQHHSLLSRGVLARAPDQENRNDDDSSHADEDDEDDDASGVVDDDDAQTDSVDAPRVTHVGTPVSTEATAPPSWGDKLSAVTPLGEVLKAKRLLQGNLIEQARIASLMRVNHNETAFNMFVDKEVAKVVAETNSPALGRMLAKMRKEMQKFSAPAYLEYLAKKKGNLLAEEVTLQANLDAAQVAMREGPQGWRVVESHLNKPTTLRGASTTMP